MSTTGRILVTSALPYANGPIHLGHLAGAYLPADVFVRYQRLRGKDVLYICGSDEHGAAIVMRAIKDETTPKEIADRYHAMAEKDFAAFGMSFDYYGRTSSEVHHETAQEWFRALAPGLTIKTEEQLYDPKAKLFLADRFVKGTCPICQNPDAYGDQCERCGSTLSPTELIDPRSTVSDAVPELRKVSHWYLPMGAHQARLEAWIGEKTHWKPNVLGQVKSWFAAGLGDRAMTRDLPWGVPVPEDVAKAAGIDPAGKVLYVWFDAPIGYVSATREWAAKNGDAAAWKTYWQSPDTRLLFFIGKDNIVFHCLSFPLMMMLHGDLAETYTLPENVPANEFLNLEGDKLSTSRGWAVWLGEALEAFDPDYLRYALLRALPETKDSDFSWGDFQAHVNNELADNFGNFVNRTVQFAVKYMDGTVPPAGEARADVTALEATLAERSQKVGAAIDECRMRDAILELMEISRAGNKFFNDAEPWRTRREDEAHCNTTIRTCLELCASLSILVEPFLPFTARRLREVLRLEGVRDSGVRGGVGIGWDAAARLDLLPDDHPLGEPTILVRKVEDEQIEAQRALLATRAQEAAAQKGPPYEAVKDVITYDDFAKLDLRVGKVLSAEPVKKSDRLLCCQVDLGFERRQILAGVAKVMKPEDLVGKTVVVVANLAPRKMVGLESQGMLLMAEDREGKLVPLVADSEPGSTIS
ncbi:MAG: methionine--tRNA ligase [Sandaracinaceae bacterium]